VELRRPAAAIVCSCESSSTARLAVARTVSGGVLFRLGSTAAIVVGSGITVAVGRNATTTRGAATVAAAEAAAAEPGNFDGLGRSPKYFLVYIVQKVYTLKV